MKLLFLFLVFSHIVYGNQQIKGIVIDHDSKNPVPFATIYLNESTKGTISDENGRFSLSGITFPAELVVSHLSYKIKALKITRPSSDLVININKKKVDLEEVAVSDYNLREENIKRFKYAFAGSDHWGKNAFLLNDSALVFNCEYNSTKQNDQPENIRNLIMALGEKQFEVEYIPPPIEKLKSLEVTTKAPLFLDMPLLGYKLRIDLDDFKILYEGSTYKCYYGGNYFFQPYPEKSKHKTKKYEKNRKKAYYNSRQHFCKSLVEGKLKQNGYLLKEEVAVDSSLFFKNPIYRSITLDTTIHQISNSLFQVSGLADKKFKILYHQDKNGKPIDMTVDTSYYPIWSEVLFLKDTCYITDKGIIPNYDIVFIGKIGKKLAGSMVPFDYCIKEE